MPSTIWAPLLSVIYIRCCHKWNHASWDTADKFRLECGCLSCSLARAWKGVNFFFLILQCQSQEAQALFVLKATWLWHFPGMRWQPLPSTSGKMPQALELWKYIQFTLWSFPKSDTTEIKKYNVYSEQQKWDWKYLSIYRKRNHGKESFLGKYLTMSDLWSPGLWFWVANMQCRNISSFAFLITINATFRLFW